MMKTINVLTAALAWVSASAVAGNDAPINPWLADSPWAMAHGDPYQSDAVEGPGPLSAQDLGAPQFVYTGPININLLMSPVYPDGQRVWWGNDVLQVYKVGLVNGKLTKLKTLSKGPIIQSGFIAARTPTSGAYTLLLRDNIYVTVRGNTFYAFEDTDKTSRNSPIRLKQQMTLSADVLTTDDAIVGLNLLWDGNIAFASRRGIVGVVSQDFQRVHSLKLSGSPKEEVSNSIAADEQGGVYVVSSEAMYRVQWTGNSISLAPSTGAWRASYDVGGEPVAGRHTKGSGTTPTLMGVNGHRLVTIADGAKLGKVVVFWRDAIPSDWQPIGPGKDLRIAGEAAIDYGQPERAISQTEQSLVVSGYGVAAVSNDYQNVAVASQAANAISPIAHNLMNGLIQLGSAIPKVQPWGMQKFEWDPHARKLNSVWSRTDVSCPNAIPTMSQTSNRFYCVGAHDGKWTIEGVNWTTGQQHFRKYLGVLPRYNSFYSATQLNGDGSMIYGSVDGVVYLPAAPR